MAHPYVDPWTSPLELTPGTRARNAGDPLEREWDGSRGIPVCPPCDVAMTEYDNRGDRCCPTCGITEREAAEAAYLGAPL